MSDVRIGVFVCRWGINIAGVVDVSKTVEELDKEENVWAWEYLNICTDTGADFITEKIEEKNLERVVVAACTPRTHQPVFHSILKDAGLPPRMLEFVNIREHCSFVHMSEPEEATVKAIELIKAGIARANLLEAVPTKIVPVKKSALVVGGGIAGLTAAIDLGNEGFKVTLVEKKSTTGGRMAQLDRTFPTDDCSIWILGPKMLEANRHPNITIMSLAEVKEITGYIGNFEVKIQKNPRYVYEETCTGCGQCTDVCPIYIPNYFDENFSARKCIDIAFAQAVPAIYDLDKEWCVECYACVDSCDVHCIDLSQEPEIVELEVGTIIIATGWDLYQGDEYGYGKYENVVTQIQLERILSPNGPTLGHLKRPSDRKRPKNILFINCVGSRNEEHPWCSNVCCLLSVKNSKLIKSEYPDANIVVSYIDMRCAGKMYEEYYKRSREAGIMYINGKVGKLIEDPKTKNLVASMESIGTGGIVEFEADLVVLSSASLPSAGTDEIAQVLKLEKSPSGFLKEFHPRLDPIETKSPGIYICGSCQGQKAIDATVNHARGAAQAASIPMNKGEFVIELIRADPIDERCAKCYMCIETCPYSAISVNEAGQIEVDLISCRGCGMCAATCPSIAIELRYYRDYQFNAVIDSLFEA